MGSWMTPLLLYYLQLCKGLLVRPMMRLAKGSWPCSEMTRALLCCLHLCRGQQVRRTMPLVKGSLLCSETRPVLLCCLQLCRGLLVRPGMQLAKGSWSSVWRVALSNHSNSRDRLQWSRWRHHGPELHHYTEAKLTSFSWSSIELATTELTFAPATN